MSKPCLVEMNRFSAAAFAKRLDRARAHRRQPPASLGEMAVAAGVTVRTIQAWHTGARTPRDYTALKQLAEYLEVSCSWLNFGEGSIEAPPRYVGSVSVSPLLVEGHRAYCAVRADADQRMMTGDDAHLDGSWFVDWHDEGEDVMVARLMERLRVDNARQRFRIIRA